MWDQRSEWWDLGSQPRDKGSQAIRSGSAFSMFLGIRDQAVSFLWDQGPKFVTRVRVAVLSIPTAASSVFRFTDFFVVITFTFHNIYFSAFTFTLHHVHTHKNNLHARLSTRGSLNKYSLHVPHGTNGLGTRKTKSLLNERKWRLTIIHDSALFSNTCNNFLLFFYVNIKSNHRSNS